jgi:hypothetical protein
MAHVWYSPRNWTASTLLRHYLVRRVIEWKWIDAVKTGRQTLANWQYGGLINEICLLGNIAIAQHNTQLTFDPKTYTDSQNLPWLTSSSIGHYEKIGSCRYNQSVTQGQDLKDFCKSRRREGMMPTIMPPPIFIGIIEVPDAETIVPINLVGRFQSSNLRFL